MTPNNVNYATPAAGAAQRRDLRSQALDLLRFPLAIVVAAVHICGTTHLLDSLCPDYVAGETGWVKVLIFFVNAFLRNYSVPIYFFIAGYVFFLGITLTRDVYARKMRNRARSLLMPYVAWNVCMALIAWLHYSMHGMSIDWSVGGVLELFWNVENSVFPVGDSAGGFYPIDQPLWFVRNLMCMAVCTPLLQWIYRKIGGWFVVAAGAVWLICDTLNMDVPGQWMLGVFFFSWGGWVSHRRRDMIEEFRRWRKVSFVLFPALCLVFIPAMMVSSDVAWFIKDLNVIVALFFAYNLAVVLLKTGRVRSNKFLTSTSFFIYAGHSIFYSSVAKGIAMVFSPATTFEGAIYLICVLIATILLMLGLYWVMRRVCPAVLKVFTGGRI